MFSVTRCHLRAIRLEIEQPVAYGRGVRTRLAFSTLGLCRGVLTL